MPAPLILLEGAVEIGKSLIKRWFPDPADQAKHEAELERMRQDGALQEMLAEKELIQGQLEINKEEAKHTSVLVAGWRPAIGWVCAISLGVYYIPRFLIGMAIWAYLSVHSMVMLPLPEMGVADIIGLVTVLLGSSFLRSREKEKGIARESLSTSRLQQVQTPAD